MDDEIKICSNCGSTDIDSINGYKTGSIRDYCKTCNYGATNQGLFPIIKKSDIKLFKNKIKSRGNIRTYPYFKKMNPILSWILLMLFLLMLILGFISK
ncbi:hypothetical protein JXM83_06905 [Candidatus Woesearchaeota archaeon]|nr:hypothetical protein [Candidatus Woesearchaeota archaeon]